MDHAVPQGMDRVWVRGLDPYLVFSLVPKYVCVHVYVYVYVYVYVCMSLYVYVYMHVYVCVCGIVSPHGRRRSSSSS